MANTEKVSAELTTDDVLANFARLIWGEQETSTGVRIVNGQVEIYIIAGGVDERTIAFRNGNGEKFAQLQFMLSNGMIDPTEAFIKMMEIMANENAF